MKNIKRLFLKNLYCIIYLKLYNIICNEKAISKQIIGELYNILNDWKKYIYDDALEFLKSLKSKGYIINILTYGDLDFQVAKLHQISLNDYINNIIVTNKYKYTLNINYENSVFIDDNPRDIEGIYKNHAKKVIRIRRPKTKYYNEKIGLTNIECYKSLKEIDLNKL